MIGGQAAGTAVALAAMKNRAVQSVDINALRNLLVRQRQVIEFVKGPPEKFQGEIYPQSFDSRTNLILKVDPLVTAVSWR